MRTTGLHEHSMTAPGLQAIEAGRNEEARDACVRKGLKVAATDAAKAKLVRIVHSADELSHAWEAW